MCDTHTSRANAPLVMLQAADGQFLMTATLFPGAEMAVKVATTKTQNWSEAALFCTAENALKFAELLNGHTGPGYWSRVLR